MKKQILSSTFFILSFLSLNAFAHLPGVTLLSSKTDMSPGLKGGFVETSFEHPDIGSGGARAYAQASSAYGRKNENIRISGQHNYIIENRSGKSQYYEVEYRVTLDDGRFIRKQDVLRIDNNSIERGGASSYMYQMFSQPGSYHFSVETSIRGEYSAYSRDGNYVIINA